LLLSARAETDESKRKQMYGEMQALVRMKRHRHSVRSSACSTQTTSG